MDHEAVLLTLSGVEKLKKEKEHLINVERPKVIEELQLARSQGDLSENADYDSARDKQAHIESRIKEIDLRKRVEIPLNLNPLSNLGTSSAFVLEFLLL